MQGLDPYNKLLTPYQIDPHYVEDYGKIKKVFANQGTFALKQTKLTDEQRYYFNNTFKVLNEKGYRQVVPIYPTKQGELLLNRNGYDYYLMPWIESARSSIGEIHEDLLKEIARIHTLTTIKEKIKQEHIQNFYEKSKYEIEKRKLDYEKFIDRCEQHVYMSPFELLYCTYFIQLMNMEEGALRQLEDWYELAKEKKTDRFVICHGNLAPSHVLYDENGQSYLTNFERTYSASPIYDLLTFFRKMFNSFPQPLSNAHNLYFHYNRFHKLTEDEQQLLFYYLSSTKKVHKHIVRYQSSPTKSEQAQVVALQRAIWQVQMGSSFVYQLSQAIEQAKNQDNENPT
ncbi:spore coat protein YsxE [Bacillus sp. Marseille-P3661]|uniref:spore coat protein YsxE n=1 Tax=Bacillus sp. Marseille-P3661 TaxID=1936234 RepID=UPI000C830C30|nr:spore coat protein YsxE [Bacillus sp. Marseille-P3661]